jgi:hypothetical protein
VVEPLIGLADLFVLILPEGNRGIRANNGHEMRGGWPPLCGSEAETVGGQLYALVRPFTSHAAPHQRVPPGAGRREARPHAPTGAELPW